MKITKDDFEKAKDKVLHLKKGDIPESLYIWSINKHSKYITIEMNNIVTNNTINII
jgi:hypothetical protein